MANAKRKADHEVLFLEVPRELKERLTVVAGANRRSMTAEATVAIERHVAAEEAARPAEPTDGKAKKGGAR